nr:2-oxoglutarate dehydrogenase complex component E1-like [Lytechinus pictus]
MYQSWLENPSSVHKSWDIFFRNAQNGAAPGTAYVAPPPISSMFPSMPRPTVTSSHPAMSPAPSKAVSGQLDRKVIEDHLSVQTIIRSYQVSLLCKFLEGKCMCFCKL